MEPVLSVEGLSVRFFVPRGEIQAVRGVSFQLFPGETLALVGESGCGKSVLCKSILHLLPSSARITSGRITAQGRDITHLPEREMVKLRGRLFAMAPQNPMSALNPAIPIGAQVAESVRLRDPGLRRREVRRRTLDLLSAVGIEDPEGRFRQYPRQLSGGLCQRAALAIALAARPKILLADEPTTALDATIQAKILDLLGEIRERLNAGVLLVTHDLGVAARAADRVAVMYAGKIVETGRVEEIFDRPLHPYTQALLRCHPALVQPGEPLRTIPGAPPDLLCPPVGDAFACRNPEALAIDYEEEPPVFSVTDTHSAAAWRLDPRAARPSGKEEGAYGE